MTTNSSEEPAEQLMELIVSAKTLSEDRKDLYIEELLEGRMHPDLLANLDNLAAQEALAAEEDIRQLQESEEATEAVAALAEQESMEEAQPLVAEHEAETHDIVVTYNQECTTIDRSLDQGIEGAVREEESTEADAIRAMLKGGTDQNAAQ